MDEFMKTEFYKKLPEDVKEKLKNCTSEEEVMDILNADMSEIPVEMLENVAGGDCYMRSGPCNKYVPLGDSREDMPSDKANAKDFEEGRITGADFFK